LIIPQQGLMPQLTIKMNKALRPTGIDVIGDISWGTHFCHFYETEKDLFSVLVPFFKAGLENNEYCIWVTSPGTSIKEAFAALKKAVPLFDKYMQRGSIEIIPYTDWYIRNGKLDLENAIPAISDRLQIALQRNFEGVRANGDESWVNRKEWESFIEYENKLTPIISKQRLIVLCTYPLSKSGAATDLLDIAMAHESAIVKRKGKWEVLEAPEIKKSKAHMQRENEILGINVAERTKELEKVNSILDNSQSRLRAIFDTTDIAFLLLDSDLHVLTYNEIANHWSELSFGVKLNEGSNFIELLKEDRRGPVREMMNTVMGGTPVNYETDYPLQDGSSEWYCISINPVHDLKNHIIGLCCSATNITTGKLAEIEQIRISNDLVNRNKDLEQFAYMVSHDMRAPLANIISLSHMLKQADLPPGEKIELEEFLFQSLAKLDEVIKDMNEILQNKSGSIGTNEIKKD
jgi:PAS domain S-box-containing protein